MVIMAGCENAVELYHRVQATDPENVIAAEGLNEITAQVAADADALLLQGELERVEILLTQAQAAALPQAESAAAKAKAEKMERKEKRRRRRRKERSVVLVQI